MSADTPVPMTAQQWNDRHGVGSVFVRTDTGERVKTRSEAWDLGHGEAVVKVEGAAGGIGVRFLSPDDNPGPMPDAFVESVAAHLRAEYGMDFDLDGMRDAAERSWWSARFGQGYRAGLAQLERLRGGACCHPFGEWCPACSLGEIERLREKLTQGQRERDELAEDLDATKAVLSATVRAEQAARAEGRREGARALADILFGSEEPDGLPGVCAAERYPNGTLRRWRVIRSQLAAALAEFDCPGPDER